MDLPEFVMEYVRQNGFPPKHPAFLAMKDGRRLFTDITDVVINDDDSIKLVDRSDNPRVVQFTNRFAKGTLTIV